MPPRKDAGASWLLPVRKLRFDGGRGRHHVSDRHALGYDESAARRSPEGGTPASVITVSQSRHEGELVDPLQHHCRLAERMGIDPPALCRLETGKTLNPTLASRIAWCSAC